MNKLEIGSEFWLEQNGNNSEVPPFTVNETMDIKYLMNGRGAINYLLNELKISNRTVYLPSYLCESVIQPFEEHNYSVYFYDINDDLTIDIESISFEKSVGIFFVLSYFGFNTHENFREIRGKFNKSTVIIEDTTHSLFSDTVNIESDYKIASIRKWLGTPSGGFVAGRNLSDNKLDANEKFISLRKDALLMKSEYMNSKLTTKHFLNIFSEAEELIDVDAGSYKMDDESMKIINSYNYEKLKKRRIDNYNYLLSNISNEKIEIIFPNLTSDIVPMFFPIYSEKRDELRKYLISKQIYCPIHWPVPELLDNIEDFNSKNIYKSILSIPCDQRYSEFDMNRIVEVINEW